MPEKRRRTAAAGGVWVLAEREHGVVSRRQLLDTGLSSSAIQRRIASRRLHPVAQGVYAVGRPELTVHGRWMAADLMAPAGAVLSHRSAAALWGVASLTHVIEVSVFSAAPQQRRGIRAHRRPTLRPCDMGEHEGIPVTGVVQTLIDLAGQPAAPRIERAVNEADRLDLIDPDALRAALEDHRGRIGVARLRSVLDRRVFRLTDSDLERMFLALVGRAGLPVPRTRQWLNGFRVDFHWPDLGLVVETDGLRYHRTPAQQARAGDATRRTRSPVSWPSGPRTSRCASSQTR
jgi:hypothetical protein